MSGSQRSLRAAIDQLGTPATAAARRGIEPGSRSRFLGWVLAIVVVGAVALVVALIAA